jgi:hypothetical protein
LNQLGEGHSALWTDVADEFQGHGPWP